MKFNPESKHNPKRIYEGYWMSQEIRKHASVSAFPDWGILWKYKKNSIRKKIKYKNDLEYRQKRLRECKKYREKYSDIVKKRKAKWQKNLTKEQRREYYLRWYKKNTQEIRKRLREKARLPEVRKKINDRQKIRLRNPSFKLRKNLGRGLSSICNRQGYIKDRSVLKYLGCNIDFFKNQMELKFSKKMTWDNYGIVWHIDHIIPCAAFDHNDEKQISQCWHWTNMRPLIAKENLQKSDKITEPQFKLKLSA